MGYRTPVILSWPGVIAEGRRTEHVVSAIDLFDTSLSAAGVAVPSGRRGHDLWPYLTGHGELDRSSVIGYVSRVARPLAVGERAGTIQYAAWYVRTKEWRYVWHVASDREQLYRIAHDPLEEVDVSSEHEDVTRNFRAEVLAWKELVVEPSDTSH
jgi:arylsulfatase A-like enzyme